MVSSSKAIPRRALYFLARPERRRELHRICRDQMDHHNLDNLLEVLLYSLEVRHP
jgi:hypothetical protein